MAKKERSKFAKESDRIRKLIKRFVSKNELDRETYTKIKEQFKFSNREQFFEMAEQFHSFKDIQNAFEEIADDLGLGDKIPQPFKEDSPLEYDYNSDPYEAPQTESDMIIDSWWHDVSYNTLSNKWNSLPVSVYDRIAEWKDATIALIGKDNFADLIERKMNFNVDTKFGDVDFTEFFTVLYDTETHSPESTAEVASRISFWLQQATNEALDYLSEDEDMGAYDEIVGQIIDALDDLTW